MESELQNFRICLACKKPKDLADFYHHKQGGKPYKPYTWCKPCHHRRTEEWRKQNLTRSHELDRESRLRFKEKRKAACRAWYAANKVKQVLKAKQRYWDLRLEILREYGG